MDDYSNGWNETLQSESSKNNESLDVAPSEYEPLEKGRLQNASNKGNESSIASPRGTGCEAPPPSPYPSNESSKADLSEDEFGLNFEPDSDINQEIWESESVEDSERYGEPLRIRDIVRPESIASSWDIPSDDSRVGSQTPTWKDLERKYAAVKRSLRQASTTLESAESSERLKEGMSECEVRMAALTKNAFNIDSKIWDGLYWHEILACGRVANHVNNRDPGRDIEVLASVDHVEDVSALSGAETYFQPGEVLQAKRTVEYKPGGVCPYTSLCCHFHDASGRILTQQCPHPRLMQAGCCYDHETSKTFLENEQLGDCIIRTLLAASSTSQVSKESNRSAKEVFLILEDVLRITAIRDTEENKAEQLRLDRILRNRRWSFLE